MVVIDMVDNYVFILSNLWAAAAAADPSWDGMSRARQSRGSVRTYWMILNCHEVGLT